MMRSLYSGVSGLRNHQTRMDVIGNNIANVNTVGFKAGRTIFQDLYSQNMSAASSPGESTGGTNPKQIGLGVNLSTIDTLFTRSAAQVTGSTYDLMIENDGFFVVRNGFGASYEEFYTRAGNFYEDKAHYLVTSNGYYVQGYKAMLFQGDDPVDGKATSIIATSWNGHVTPAMAAKVSSKNSSLTVSADPGAAANNKTYTMSVAYDGIDYTITVTDGVWTDSGTVNAATLGTPGNALTFVSPDGVHIATSDFATATDVMGLDGVTVTTDNSGSNAAPASTAIADIASLDMGAKNNGRTYEFAVLDASKREVRINTFDSGGFLIGSDTTTFPAPGATAITRTVVDLQITFAPGYDINAFNGMKVSTDNTGVDKAPLGSPYSQISSELDRIYVDENLYNVSVDKNGNITGIVRKDGIIIDPMTGDSIAVLADQKVVIGRVAVATFDNQQGLEKVGGNLYRSTANTGEAQYKYPGSDGAGQINPGALEMSNVDLAQEFTDMIITQRGFQANSRIITVSDTLLEELVNLKR